MKQTKTGVLFDFNGTLFQDGLQQETAWRIFARETFSREITDEEFKQNIHGRNNAFIMQFLSGKELDDKTVERFVEEKETLYRQLCRENPETFHLTKGSEKLLDELKKQDVPRNIATASRRSNVMFYIESFGLEHWFDIEKIVYDDGTIPGKPEPDYYLRAAEKIGLSAQNCIVAEDAVSGLLSAWRAQAKMVVAVAHKEQQEAFLQMTQVDAVIADFDAFDRSWLR